MDSSTTREDDPSESLREIVSSLRSPIAEETTLLQLLAAPLACFGILPAQYRKYDKSPIVWNQRNNLARWIPLLQTNILENVLPTWGEPLKEDGLDTLLEAYFCPSRNQNSPTSSYAPVFALHAYSSLLHPPIQEFSVRLLARLSVEYPLPEIHRTIFSADFDVILSHSKEGKKTTTWEDFVRVAFSVPAKVANALAEKSTVPNELLHTVYFTRICQFFSEMVNNATGFQIPSLSYLLFKMINTGLFPSQSSSGGVSFFALTQHSHSANPPQSIWPSLLQTLPAPSLQTLLSSLFSSLQYPAPPLSPLPSARSLVKRQANVLQGLVGTARTELWDAIGGVLFGSGKWGEGFARVIVCWVCGAGKGDVDADGLGELLIRTLEIWSSPQHIKHSLLSHHRYLTALFYLTLTALPPTSPHVKSLSLSQQFLTSVSHYLEHLDPAIRRCGMMVVEEVASLSGKKLDFGGWDGKEDWAVWVRDLRALGKGKDVDAADSVGVEDVFETENASKDGPPPSLPSSSTKKASATPKPPPTYDSDDSLTGYISSPSSSRSPSPTPSDLDAIEKDPSLRTGAKKKPHRPVYLYSLGELLKAQKGEAEGDIDRIEMGLKEAEGLIRRKSGFGSELDENAVDLTITLIGLQDNFDTEDFEGMRVGALRALVACCPWKAAPCIIEQFFHNQYSTAQRFAMLNALALGARELADLRLPPSNSKTPVSDFPSKKLAPALHRRYIAYAEESGVVVDDLMRGITRQAIEKGREEIEDKIPEVVREKQLRVKRTIAPAAIVDLSKDPTKTATPKFQATKTPYKDVAAEYFISPLINRFWLYLRDEHTRESRTAYSTQAYKGTGTGMILDSLLLSRYLSTLGLLLHAARHSMAFLTVLAPESLEVAVTMGSRPASSIASNGGKTGSEGAVLASALELALIILDACADLDGGQTLALEHTALLLGIQEWVKAVFEKLEGGERVAGGGGEFEGRMRGASAGLVIRVEDIVRRWSRAMIGGNAFTT